jgi:hypothetical protein
MLGNAAAETDFSLESHDHTLACAGKIFMILPYSIQPMNPRSLLVLLASLISLSFSVSCANRTGIQGKGLAAYHAYDRPTKLPQNPDKVHVKVSLSKQRTYVMEGSNVLLAMPVSVGAPGSVTPSGNFKIFKKVQKKRANTHGYAFKGQHAKKSMIGAKPSGWSFKGTPMPYWCEFKPNYGFHTGWVKHHPCTHGCIRMHENLSPKFFKLVKIGTPVSIAYSQPEDTSVENFDLPPDAGPLPDYHTSMYLGDGYFERHKTPIYH